MIRRLIVAVAAGTLFAALHLLLTPVAGDLTTLLAAAPVALLLHPAQVRVNRWFDRRRASPYSLLAGLTWSGTSDTPDLARLAEAIGRGLGARVCRLTVHRPGLADRTYQWTGSGSLDDLVTLPVHRGGDRLGSITVDRAVTAGPDGRRLVPAIADSLGAVFEAHRLGIELERQLRAVRAHAADIAGSRRRLVAEMDAERRRIERDLHDGAQHHLVSLRLSLGLAEHRISTGTAADARTALERVAAQIDDAEAVLARTAGGMTSPVLAQRGLVAALEAELGPEVPVQADGIGTGRRFGAELEAAVWFCCLEAVNNARKHAPGAPVRVTLTGGEQRLEFAIHDDGPGWDTTAGAAAPGRGMRNVMARVTAVGGLVTVRSTPGSGTTVSGWVPLPGVTADGSLHTAVHQVIQEAVSRYGDDPAVERIRQIRAALDRPAQRRDAILAAWSALQSLDDLIRDDPPPDGAARLRHRLDRIRSGDGEWAEVNAIDMLRSGAAGLGEADVEAAARLLGEHGADPRTRLGLLPGAAPAEIATAAGQALAVWRTRASHPGTAHGVRLLAATVVRTCEQLVLTHTPGAAGPAAAAD